MERSTMGRRPGQARRGRWTALVAATMTVLLASQSIADAAVSSTPPPMPTDTVATPVANDATFVWAAMGDSYGSGEGNPATWRTASTDPNVFTGLRWSGSDLFYIDNPLYALTNEYLHDTTSCHRSTLAAVNKVHAALATGLWGMTFSLGHVACTGATTGDMWRYEYTPSGMKSAAMLGFQKLKQPTQLSRVVAYKNLKGRMDAVYVSGGGNDVEFGKLVGTCLDPFAGDCRDLEPTLKTNLDRLRKDIYPALKIAIEASLGTTIPVIISAYPNPLDDGTNTTPPVCSGTDYDTYGDTSSPGYDKMMKDNITYQEAVWAYGIPDRLNAVISDFVSSTSTWRYAAAHLPLAAGHGVCTADPMSNRISMGIRRQGADLDVPLGLATVSMGILHPNNRGHGDYSTGIMKALLPVVEARVLSELKQATNVRAASVTATSIVVRWDDKSKTDQRYRITVTPASLNDQAQLVKPAGALSSDFGGYTMYLAGTNVQQHTITTTARGTYLVTVAPQHLKLATDGPVSVARYVSNVVPAAPTNVTKPSISLSVSRLGWTGSIQAMDYVVRRTDTATGAVTDTRTTSTTMDIPTFGYSYKVAACNRAGCSAWTSAP